MIFKHNDGTVVEMTAAEFVELGELYDGDVESEEVTEALVKDNAEVTTDFKVGDKVEIVGFNYQGKSRHLYEIGVITKMFIDGDLGVKTIDGGGGVFRKSSLKLIEEEIAEATKPKFEIGDVVKSGGLFAKIFDDFDSDNEYRVGFFKNGSFTYLDESEIRHATEEEKSHLQTLIGRGQDEYKIGDLVELLDGFGSNFSGLEGCFFEIKAVGVKGVTIKRSNTTDEVLTEKLAWIIASNLKLITPVEWRHDFAGGV